MAVSVCGISSVHPPPHPVPTTRQPDISSGQHSVPSAFHTTLTPPPFNSSPTSRFGITHLTFYPFDAYAFLTSSYSHTLTLYATETLAASASFDLTAIISSYALSPIASH